MLCIIIAIIPSFLFFISYGGRADTASVLVLVCVAYLVWQKRPPKIYVILFGAIFAIILGTLAETRSMPNSRSFMGRVTNIYKAGENLVTGKKMTMARDENLSSGPIKLPYWINFITGMMGGSCGI